jgi:acyl-CoA synthetase (AMP-forming)/AMP-acid ligase II
VIVLDDDADFDTASLGHELKAELSSYKIPKRFMSLHRDEIPLASSGKADLRRLRKLFDA